MFIDRNAPTGLLGLGPSINEMELHQTTMQLIRAHASEDYFAQAALTLAREWSAANQEVGYLNDRLMQECQDGVMAMLAGLAIEAAYTLALNDLAFVTGIPEETLAPRYRLAALHAIRQHTASLWPRMNYPQHPVAVMQHLQQDAYQPFQQTLSRLGNAALIDQAQALPQSLLQAEEHARNRINHARHSR